MIRALISAPIPNCGQPPSTVTRWLVFMTELMMASSSMGRIVRRLITWGTSGTHHHKENYTSYTWSPSMIQFLSFLDNKKTKMVEILPHGNHRPVYPTLSIQGHKVRTSPSHSQYRDWWWPGDARSHGNGLELVHAQYYALSTRRVNITAISL